MYERHKRRYSLCDISKVDRTVDVVLLKVRATLQNPEALKLLYLSASSNSIPGCPVLGERLRSCVKSRRWRGEIGDFKVVRRIPEQSMEGLRISSEPYLLLKCHFACFKMHSKAQENSYS